jgi:ERCC4-type nuclease
VHRPGYRPKSKRKRQLFILQGLPGIGPERAGRLLDRFGSVEASISAGSNELQSVDGVGKSIAEKIKWAVSERVTPYFSRSFGPENCSAETVTLERKTITSHTNCYYS